MFGIFGKKKDKASGKDDSLEGKGYKKLSPIQRMKQELAESEGMFSTAEEIFASGDPDNMTEAEKKKITDALFPRTLQQLRAVKDTLENGESVFPAPLDAVAPGTPTMDSVQNGGKAGANGKGLPNAIGAGTRAATEAARAAGALPIKPTYPQLGKNAALEANGMSMLPDPLNRFPINPRVLKHFQSRVWITYSGCAIIATHEFVNRACTIPAEDAIAHGYKVLCTSTAHKHDQEHDEREENFLKDVKKAADKMGLNDACIRLNYKKKVFGVGVAIPRVEFREDAFSPHNKNRPYSYADEYEPKAVKPNSFKGFAVVDPHWLTYKWDDESATDPTSPHFLEPTWIEVGGKKIHRSWVIRVVNSEIPDILKPAYYYGGLSLTQMIYERVWCADKLANEAPLLAMTKRLLIADGNLEQMITDARHTNIFFKAINYFRDNFSIFIKKPSSNVTQLDTNLSELTALTMAQYQLVSAIAQIPVTKLMKNVPTGLQSTGDYEWDDYAQSLRAIQDKDYTPLCRMFFELYCASYYPQHNDMRLEIEWNPIDMPKEKELAQMSSQSAQYISHLVQTHVVDVAEARSMLRKTGYPTFQTIPTAIPDILTKIEEANDPSKQQGGMGMPMPGGGPGGGGGPQGGQNLQPVTDPTVKKNDEIFKAAVKRVLGEQTGNGGEGEQPQEGQPPQGGDQQQQDSTPTVTIPAQRTPPAEGETVNGEQKQPKPGQQQ